MSTRTPNEQRRCGNCKHFSGRLEGRTSGVCYERVQRFVDPRTGKPGTLQYIATHRNNRCPDWKKGAEEKP